MTGLKIVIQCISIYRATAMFFFILFYPAFTNEINTMLLVSSVLSDILDGYLARKFHLTSLGGKLLDLFSDKYMTCISIVFLLIEGYALLPLIFILTKEIFVISFRSVQLNGQPIIPNNRIIGGFLAGSLWIIVILHINNIYLQVVNYYLILIGCFNLLVLTLKIYVNFNKLKQIFNISN